MTRWTYIGDLNLEYGGTFYDFSTAKDGYVDAVEVVDLDSGCGFRGAVAIERKSIILYDEPEKQDRALAVIGAKLLLNGDIDDNGTPLKKGTARHRNVLTYAHQSYGHYDTESTHVVQLDRAGPMEFEGWKADRRLRANASLKNYVRREFLR